MNPNDYNLLILSSLATYLNNQPDFIKPAMVEEFLSSNFTKEEAVRLLLAAILEFDDNKEIMELYFREMVKELCITDYTSNPYYQNIKLENIQSKNWSLQNKTYKPYELFVYNDLKTYPDGRVIPQIGFFSEAYPYPCILQNNREWMMITPNEIETMRKPIGDAFGQVLTYGLGLGYFAYMAHLKDNVKSITIIECDRGVIALFNQFILPQFTYPEKIHIIESDAYEYAAKKIKYDFVFVDIWHDPSDGVDAYLKFKKLERTDTKYSYWIEDTIKYYLE